MNRAERIAALRQALAERILVLDGAMGTAVQARNLGPEDFGGAEYEGCNEYLALTRPDVLREIHADYLAAGADIIETDTFGSTSLVMAEYDLAEQAEAITEAAARLAREAADAHATDGRPRWVAGSMGPTTKAISVTGGVTFQDLQETFRGQARGLIRGGADYLLIETCQDTRNIKAALLGCRQAFDDTGEEIPMAVSGTIEPMGTMLAGQGVEALNTSLEHVDLLYIGLNCATGPAFMADYIRALSELARTRMACVPNAGLPDEDGRYLETPEMMAAVLSRFLDNGWLNLLGGCCGTGPDHIRALAREASGRTPRSVPDHRRTFVSGIENLELEESNRPVLVGERTNVIGSRRFKKLIQAGQYEEAAEIARRQVKGGAQVIDVCLADPDGEERRDMEAVLDRLIRVVKAPLMIDTTDRSVIAAALPWCQGKSIINSINLEDGEERFDQVVPLGRAHGAAFVVGCIDDDPQQGMAVTRQRKLEVATRAHDLLTGKYGVPPTDILFDPLVFPCGTGDESYIGSARETVEGVRLIKEAFPHSKTLLGISNVSFGLPPAGREVLNSVFLYHCTRAGLDAAIVNSEKLERYASIPEEERRLAEDLLFAGNAGEADAAVAAFTAHFRDATSRVKKDVNTLTLDERLANYILEGTKDGLVRDLEAALSERRPLEIINGPLMAGMEEVGRLFNNNELIVAEVLQSAEAMKAAVAHLEPLMEKSEASHRGKVVLATVKGDVHDIGKNLVEIILGNNGFEVVNLGIKIPPHELIAAVSKHDPDMIGLSGLLVRSAQEMVVAAEELGAAGCKLPILVGGAALTRSFTRRRIAPAYPGLVVYAPDAMSGLEIAGRLRDDFKRSKLEMEIEKEAAQYTQSDGRAASTRASARSAAPVVAELDELPSPPDFRRHVLPQLNLDEVWSLINPAMLYGKHLGLRGKFHRLLARGDDKARLVKEAVDAIKEECRAGAMTAAAVYKFFRAEADGDGVRLFSPEGDEAAGSLSFPRQAGGGLCLADYIRRPLPDGRRDTLCLMVTGAGAGIRNRAEGYKDEGSYLKSHVLQALALETAEAGMEWLHAQVRGLWGFADEPGTSPDDLFKTRYRGRRYSFGYPACPDLAEQQVLFQLLRPEEIGITLTDGFMMEPEASVSAVAFHHPGATYFKV
jgi:5-methyltetrahydrofolate--homocysteine methyltransferase